MKLNFYQKLLGKKFILTIAACLTMFSASFGQTTDEYKKCGNNIKLFLEQHPEFQESYAQFEQNFRDFLDNTDLRWFQQSVSGKYIIPVVVHVLHLGGVENISATQVKSQITALNTLFGMESSGLVNLDTFMPFDTIYPHFDGADTAHVVHGFRAYTDINCRDTTLYNYPTPGDTTFFTVSTSDSYPAWCDTIVVPDTLYMLNKFE